MDHRRVLYKMIKVAKSPGHKAHFNEDRLVIDGVTYDYSALKLENYALTSEKYNDSALAYILWIPLLSLKFLFFTTHHWWKYGTCFQTAEAAFQFKRAQYYKREDVMLKIKNATTPAACKRLVSLIKPTGLVEQQLLLKWMYDIFYAKFTQNHILAHKLQETKALSSPSSEDSILSQTVTDSWNWSWLTCQLHMKTVIMSLLNEIESTQPYLL